MPSHPAPASAFAVEVHACRVCPKPCVKITAGAFGSPKCSVISLRPSAARSFVARPFAPDEVDVPAESATTIRKSMEDRFCTVNQYDGKRIDASHQGLFCCAAAQRGLHESGADSLPCVHVARRGKNRTNAPKRCGLGAGRARPYRRTGCRRRRGRGSRTAARRDEGKLLLALSDARSVAHIRAEELGKSRYREPHRSGRTDRRSARALARTFSPHRP